jgi:hypothetical protein
VQAKACGLARTPTPFTSFFKTSQRNATPHHRASAMNL